MPPKAEKIRRPVFDKCAWETRIRRILKSNNLLSGIQAFYYYKLEGSPTAIIKIDTYQFENQRVYVNRARLFRPETSIRQPGR